MSSNVRLLVQDGTREGGSDRLSLQHPVFAWLGLRPITGQHTSAEHALLQKWANGRSSLVEIGVAEGASALGLREVMAREGTLWLVDPFHLGRRRWINAMKRAAHRAVTGSRNGRVVWIEKFSSEAAQNWTAPIDFLFLDGDHSEGAVRRDWNDWHRFVAPGGVVVFHDARVFPGGWSKPDWGPVRLVNDLFRANPIRAWSIVDEVDSMVAVEKFREDVR
jgi:predicted O-methyltransferase YrrM